MTPEFLSVQAIAFFAGFPRKANAAKLWDSVFETPYAAFQTPMPGITTANGVEDGFAFELQQHPERVDVIVRAAQSEPGPPATVADLEALSTRALDKLKSIIEDVVVTRISIVTTTLTKADSQESAGDLLRIAVPWFPESNDYTDQMIQLNKTTVSKSESDVTFNRLCKWSVAQAVEFKIQILGSITTPTTGEIKWFLEGMVDMNTVPNVRPSPERIPDLFEEIIEETKLIVREGAVHLA